jgi:nitrite reductase (NADH) small subunit
MNRGEQVIHLLGDMSMADFVRICAQSELPPANDVREFTVAGKTLCVANVGGSICVLNGECPHEGGPLGEGTIEDGRVVCPWHGYGFDVHTGEEPNAPELKATVFEAKVEAGELLAKL